MAKPRNPGDRTPESRLRPSAASVLQAAGELGAQLSEALGHAADPVTGIVTMGALFARPLAESGYRDGCLVATGVMEASGENEELRTACLSAYSGWLNGLTLCLQDWGVPRAEAGPLAELVLSGIEGALLLAKARQDCAPIHTVTARLGALVAAAAEPV
ncbi:hypothetical protein GXW83_27180 [Streptacidiphilus sp. PB12-B1b]|uniref:LmrA/YxaF family transcription factor n=1 Tax=Streptacidiphilus sp. PB12-B1b TaxID=2705012 RepID=UPI0015FA3BE7|nr:TetR family transcriptional regulator C-terminal domain-containing protein [Streptacidiphilus sp. PB12-B1b]QMU78834.1 hypothetical protein GXW83_27180 [Streptacidiphilus sp. PB12-B1b]